MGRAKARWTLSAGPLLACLPLIALAGACARSEPAGAPPRLAAEPRATKATGTASSAPPALLPTAAAPSDSEPPNRLASGGSTVGTIACGKSRCQAGKQLCVLDPKSEWICVSAPPQVGPSFACDDASDCQAPKTCCQSFASGEVVYACEKPDGDCAALVCSEPDGTRCPRGEHCQEGFCQQETQATCGDKRCPPATPYCLWAAAPTCVSREAATTAMGAFEPDTSKASGVYACTKPSDCGTLRCCTDMAYGDKATYCQQACDPGNTMQLCARDSDCGAIARSWCGDDAACRRATRCVPAERSSSALPVLKVCRQLDH